MTTATCPLASSSWSSYLQKEVELCFVREIAGQLEISFWLGKVEMPFSCSMSESSGLARRSPLNPSTTNVSGSLIKCLATHQSNTIEEHTSHEVCLFWWTSRFSDVTETQTCKMRSLLRRVPITLEDNSREPERQRTRYGI